MVARSNRDFAGSDSVQEWSEATFGENKTGAQPSRGGSSLSCSRYDSYDESELIAPTVPRGGNRPSSFAETAANNPEVIENIKSLDRSASARAGLVTEFQKLRTAESLAALKLIINEHHALLLESLEQLPHTENLQWTVVRCDTVRHDSYQQNPGPFEHIESIGSGYSQGHDFSYERRLFCCAFPAELSDDIRALLSSLGGPLQHSESANNHEELWKITTGNGRFSLKGGEPTRKYHLQELVTFSLPISESELKKTASVSNFTVKEVELPKSSVYPHNSTYSLKPKSSDYSDSPNISVSKSFTDLEMHDSFIEYRVSKNSIKEAITELTKSSLELTGVEWS